MRPAARLSRIAAALGFGEDVEFTGHYRPHDTMSTRGDAELYLRLEVAFVEIAIGAEGRVLTRLLQW